MCLVGDGHTNIKLTKDSLITLEENTYDYILTNVPYGDYKGSAPIANFSFGNKKRYENLFLEKVVKALRPGGKAVVIIPDGVLESPSLDSFRVNLLNNVKVPSIISLHQYVFRPYTTEKTYAIILQRRQEAEIGRNLDYDIFMYILENDGYQKGDKRYAIRENNIPDLLRNYNTEHCTAPFIFTNINSLNGGNFHNLTPEFYLNYYEVDYKDVQMNEYQEIIDKLKTLNRVLENPFNE
jgi:type I restriction-modification system DNA methylase subunit